MGASSIEGGNGSLRTARGPHSAALALAAAASRRPVVSGPIVVLGVALYFTFGTNLALWTALLETTGSAGSRPMLLAGIAVLLVSVFVVLGTLLDLPYVFKPIVTALLLVSVVVDHFMSAHGVVIDATMVRNTFETDARESLELITRGLLVHVTVFGLLPAALLGWVRTRRERPAREVARRLLAVALGTGVAAGTAVGSYKSLAPFVRTHREVRHLVTPFNYLEGARRYLREEARSKPGSLVAVGTDARRSVAGAGSRRPKLVVLVVGETARASSFSLNGYARPTNPELSSEDVIAFSRALSCATATSLAVPCMFSADPREAFVPGSEKSQENLLDVLGHAGVRLLWRENNTGCKNVCNRVPTEVLDRTTDPRLCASGECFDEALLDGLEGYVAAEAVDTLIVLHQRGSHGPAYHLRYPPDFRRFVPTCDTNDLHECDRAAVANTYDNTILYTDHVLGELIRRLRNLGDRFDTGMIYVSDHGESLGEHNLYLHSLPYSIAPDEQTHVPFVVWLSPELRRDLDLDSDCVTGLRDEPVSHDNLFHTVLGAFEIETAVRDDALDVFARCRGVARKRSPDPHRERRYSSELNRSEHY